MGASASADEEPTPVTLHVYSLGKSNQMMVVNAMLMTLGSGAFHCGVEVHGREWSFRGTDDCKTGIFSCAPQRCSDHTWHTSVPMGSVRLSVDEVESLIRGMVPQWPGARYNVFKRNCCHFCDALCVSLGLGHIPDWTTHLAGAGAAVESVYESSGAVISSTAGTLYETLGSAGLVLGGACLARKPGAPAQKGPAKSAPQDRQRGRRQRTGAAGDAT